MYEVKVVQLHGNLSLVSDGGGHHAPETLLPDKEPLSPGSNRQKAGEI
jgi:hypothetical protein